MKTQLLKLIIVLLVLFSGCKKHENNQESLNPPSSSYIKSISVYDTNSVLRIVQTLEYDSLHRLKKLTILELATNPDSILQTFSIDYSPIRVFMKETTSTSTIFFTTITYYLNSSGLADSSKYVNYGSPGDSTSQSFAYTYNSSNQLLTMGEKFADSIFGTLNFHYSNMNVDYSTAVPSHGDSKELYFYNSAHFNTIGNENSGVGFLGKSCSQPLVKVTSEAMSVDMANYSYEYDQLNRISKMVVNGSSITPDVDFFSLPIIMPHQVMVYTYY